MPQQFNFVVVVWSEVYMSPFGRHRLIAQTVPEEDGFTESGSRCDQGNRLVLRRWSSDVENFDFVRSQQQNAVGHRFEIVEQPHFRYIELFRQSCAIDYPWEIGRLAT